MEHNNLKKHFFKRGISDYKEDNDKKPESNKDDLCFLCYVGSNIRTIRKSQKKTISYIADMAKISAKYLQGVEVGKRNISVTNLNKIANVLNVPISLLFCNDPIESIEKNKKLLNIAIKLRDYSIKQLENIDNIISDINRIEG